MKQSFIILTLLALFSSVFADGNSTEGGETTGTVEIRYNSTVITDDTYLFKFENTPVAYTKSKQTGDNFKVYVPSVQYVPGNMGYQPKYADIRFTQCTLGVNQMILYETPSVPDYIDLSTALTESPNNAHLITQNLINENNGTYVVKVSPGQAFLVMSHYAGYAIDGTTGEFIIQLKDLVNCTIEFVGSEETKAVPSVFMFIGTVLIIALPGILVLVLGLFVKPREDESKTSVGYQKRVRSSTTCMYILAFILTFIAFCVLLIVALI